MEGRRRSINMNNDSRRSGDKRRTSNSSGFPGDGNPNQLDGPVDQLAAALDSALTRQAKMPIRPVHARKSMDRNSVNNERKPMTRQPFQNERSFSNDRALTETAPVRSWVAMARESAAVKDNVMHAADTRARSGHGSSGSGDENVNGKMSGSGAKSWCKALCNGVVGPDGASPNGKGRQPAGTFANRAAVNHGNK
jgi:hypothetical protein